MLRWTPAGAVSAPTTVQLRLTRHYPDRVRAGAPEPARCLSPEELRANLVHFTEGLRGPRTRPCTTLVLSGLGLGRRSDLPGALDLARSLGMDRIVVHASTADLLADGTAPPAAARPQWRERIDVLVLPCPAPDEAPALAAVLAARVSRRLVCTVDLGVAAREGLGDLLEALVAGRPDEVVWTLPFPRGVDSRPPPLGRVRRALATALPTLADAGVATTVKGLPRCLSPGLVTTRRRTGNRWYVDADHQLDQALLFLPEVVRFHKGDACRFCVEDSRCDGYFAPYLAGPDAAELVPVTDA
jgi:hypothetical protein